MLIKEARQQKKQGKEPLITVFWGKTLHQFLGELPPKQIIAYIKSFPCLYKNRGK